LQPGLLPKTRQQPVRLDHEQIPGVDVLGIFERPGKQTHILQRERLRLEWNHRWNFLPCIGRRCAFSFLNGQKQQVRAENQGRERRNQRLGPFHESVHANSMVICSAVSQYAAHGPA
jgi:hypothetical protein